MIKNNIIINITWNKYIEVQSYLLANLDTLTFKMNNGNVDVLFNTEEAAAVFKLKYSL